jgi:hypothetical protein
MNYLKKLKSLGFKKIPAMVVCEYDEVKIRGFYITTLKKAESMKQSLWRRPFEYPRIASEYVSRIHTYLYRLSNEVSIYLIIVGEEFTVVVQDDREVDTFEYGSTVKNNVYIPIHSNKLTESFWKDIINSLGKGLQRDILIKEILVFK